MDGLTNLQLNYLEAICANPREAGKQESIKKYNLKSTAQIVRAKASLEKKDIIDTMGQNLIILDPLFRQWLIKRYFRK